MSGLKYLQLFEAFESQNLSKTLKFINSGDRGVFMLNLKHISNRLDFPISKFNDDMFEYLPFNAALKKKSVSNEIDKEVCKRESDWIRGEFCQGGRVKRTWGTHTRMTECPGCNGTGFKPYRNVTAKVTMIKFWFNKDGNLVCITGVDGVLRPQRSSDREGLTHDYEWNNVIDVHYMSIYSYNDIEKRLKNAHFAIILDLGKLTESEFKKLSLTKSERELRKSGAFLKPEEVREANISRYLDILIKRFDVNKGMCELTKSLPRMLGYTNILTFALRSYNIREIDDLISELYSFMQNPSDSNQRSVVYCLERAYSGSRYRNETINKTVNHVWDALDKGTGDINTKAKKYFETYEEISEILFKLVSSEKIETLTDIETLMGKIKSIRQFVDNTRINSLLKLRTISDYLGGGYFDSISDNFTELIERAAQVHNQIIYVCSEYGNSQSEIEELKKVILKIF